MVSTETQHATVEKDPIRVKSGQQFNAESLWKRFSDKVANQGQEAAKISVRTRLNIEGIGEGEMRVELAETKGQLLPYVKIIINNMDEATSHKTTILCNSTNPPEPIHLSYVPYGENIRGGKKGNVGFIFGLDPDHHNPNEITKNIALIRTLNFLIKRDNSSRN